MWLSTFIFKMMYVILSLKRCVFYLMNAHYCCRDLKCFGCVSTVSLLEACLVPVWEGVLVLGWANKTLGPLVRF